MKYKCNVCIKNDPCILQFKNGEIGTPGKCPFEAALIPDWKKVKEHLEELKKLAEDEPSQLEGYKQYLKRIAEGHRPGCALDMVEEYAACRCGVDKENI